MRTRDFFNIISLVNFTNIKLSNVTDELHRRSYQYHITSLQASAFLTKVFHQTISFNTYLQSFYASVHVLASEKLPIDLIKIFCNSLNYIKQELEIIAPNHQIFHKNLDHYILNLKLPKFWPWKWRSRSVSTGLAQFDWKRSNPYW